LLEQRIGRVHRMGQERPVQVFLLVTEQTIEENLLATLAVKHELAEAVLDPDSDVDALDMFGSLEELRQRLEVLLGARPAAGVDEREREGREREIEAAARRERLAVAGGALVGAAFSFLGELLPAREPAPESEHLAERFRRQLAECIEEDESGRPTLRVKLPDRSALDGLARSLGRLLAEHGGGCCLWRGGPTVSARRDGGVG
jgi:CRISPR/Cas system-associated endonuclease/helicase Cas3